MDWRVVVLTAADSAIGGMSVIQGLFDRIWMALRAPKDMALFARSPMGDLIFAEMYFSPASVGPCAEIIAKYNGRPCAKPPKESETALLIRTLERVNDLL